MKTKLLLLAAALFTINAFAQVPNYVPTNGLVGWWPFNANANDESGNGNNGTNTGATLTSDRFANANSAYDFDGITQYIIVNHSSSLSFTNAISVSFWMRETDYTLGVTGIDDRNPIGKQRTTTNSGLQFETVDAIGTCCGPQFSLIGSSSLQYEDPTALSLNTWVHIVGTYDGSVLKLYLNGNLLGSQSGLITLTSILQPLNFGREGTNGRYYKGQIDDIGFWSRAITPCEINQLYTSQLSTPVAEITPESSTSFCQGGSVILTANSGASYLWSPGGATTQGITVTSTNTYTVTVIDGNGCSATSTATTVTVNPNPTVTLSPLSALCSNAQAVTLTGGSPANGSYTIDGNAATAIQPWLLSAGSHPVVYSYTDGNGCIGTATQSVTINTAPTVTLSGLGTNYLVTDGPVQLTGTPSGGIFTGAGVQGNMFDPSLAGLGTHSVIYMYSNGCMNADGLCTTVDLQIGIGDGNDMNGNGGNLSVMPNPTSGSFTINLNAVNPLGLTTLEIYNALGQLIQSEQINNQSNTLKKQIELNVAKGIYTVRLTTNGNVYSEKLIIR